MVQFVLFILLTQLSICNISKNALEDVSLLELFNDAISVKSICIVSDGIITDELEGISKEVSRA